MVISGRILVLALSVTLLSACQISENPENKEPSYKDELVIYSGVTMVRPLKKLADEFSAQHHIKVTIHQGASGFLYQTLKKEQQGDIYFPGSQSYRTNNLADGFMKEYVFVGYNRIAMVVAKGNPKNLSDDLNQLTNPDLSVVLVPPNAGSIGRSSKALLDKVHLTTRIYDNVTYFTTDSSRLITAIIKGDADVALNWYAAGKWPEALEFVDLIALDPKLAIPKRLELNLLKFSKKPELARSFMKYVSSEHGLQTFHQYGFLTDKELQQAKLKASKFYQVKEQS